MPTPLVLLASTFELLRLSKFTVARMHALAEMMPEARYGLDVHTTIEVT